MFVSVSFGTKLMGETDTVPSLFHVATKFFHVNYLPLIPLQTYLVLHGPLQSAIRNLHPRVDDGGSSSDGGGMVLPMRSISSKSVAIAWLRCLGVLAVVVAAIYFLIVIFVDDTFSTGERVQAAGYLIGSIGMAWFFDRHRWFCIASYERACQLTAEMGEFGPIFQLLVDSYFGQAAYAVVDNSDELDDLEMLPHSEAEESTQISM